MGIIGVGRERGVGRARVSQGERVGWERGNQGERVTSGDMTA